MGKRQQIGRQLVASGRIAEEQLDAALAMQRQFGGRLGTNLIELGVLRVDQIAEELGRQLGVEAAVKDHFVRADRALFKQFPLRLVQRYSAVPLAMLPGRARIMAVALLDPLDLGVIDELRMVLSCQIQPLVAPEARLQYVIEKVWGIKPKRRTFIRMDFDPHQLQQAFAKMQRRDGVEPIATGPVGVTPVPPPTAGAARAATAGRPLPGNPRRQPLPTHLEPPPLPPPRPAPAAVVPAAVVPAAVVPARVVPARAVVHAARVSRAPPPRPPEVTLRDTLDAIGVATQRDQAAAAAVAYLAGRYGCGILLLIKDQLALGWRGYAPRAEAATLEALLLPLGAPSVFAQVFESGQPFRGPTPPSGEVLHERFWRLLRCAPPEEVLVVPVLLGTRVIQLVYVHDGDGRVLPRDAGPDVAELAAALGSAYRRLIQQQRT